MTQILADRCVVRTSPERLRSMLDDAAALNAVLPGAEGIESVAPGRFRGVLATRIQFMLIRADVEATLVTLEASRLELRMHGRPRGLAGAFQVTIPFGLQPTTGDDGHPATDVDYSVELVVTGRLAVFGTPLLRDTLRRQIAAMLTNLDRIAVRPPGGAGG